MIKDKININDLYFGVKLMPLSYWSQKERISLKTYNLFDLSKVKWSVAMWVTMGEKKREEITNPLHFLFGDVWSRAEYEFIVCPWPYGDGEGVSENGQKVDTFTMYVLPNEKLLMDMVNRVTKSSASKYLAEWRKTYKR